LKRSLRKEGKKKFREALREGKGKIGINTLSIAKTRLNWTRRDRIETVALLAWLGRGGRKRIQGMKAVCVEETNRSDTAVKTSRGAKGNLYLSRGAGGGVPKGQRKRRRWTRLTEGENG